MNRVELVAELMAALQSGDLELAANVLADDFEMSGFTPKPMSKAQLLAMQSELLAAMPDFSYNLSGLQRAEDGVRARIAVSGTQTEDLTLALFGLETIPATGLSVILPQVAVTYQFHDDRVARMNVESESGGGLNGLLQQVGAELPLLPREGEGDIAG